MSASSMNVARRYARALHELGHETGTLDALVAEMASVAAGYESSPELRESFENPLVGHDAKREILDELAQRMGLGNVTRNVLQMLADRRRLRALPEIVLLLREMSDARRGIVRAEVTSAVRLDPGYYDRLRLQLEKMTGKKVEIDVKEDPSLIAGVVTRIGDTVIDGSLRSRLQEMKNSLLADATTASA